MSEPSNDSSFDAKKEMDYSNGDFHVNVEFKDGKNGHAKSLNEDDYADTHRSTEKTAEEIKKDEEKAKKRRRRTKKT